MNEFIVFDKTEVGKKPRLVKFDAFSIKENWIYLELDGIEVLHAHLDDVEICYFIRKTDIEGEKIYAESSIVEFDFGTITGNHKSKVIGVFKYSTYSLRYNIHLYDKRERVFSYNSNLMQNLKVIGSLQEKPELLGDAE